MSNFYCAAPWRGLHINPNGDVKTCCAGDPNMLGNLNTQSIEQILNGPKLKEIRNTLSKGQAHEYCKNCVEAERFHSNGERSWHNNVNPDIDYATAGDYYHWPAIVDVRWNTTCNLSCNYCAPKASSKWAMLENIPFKSGTRPYYQDVCDFIQKHQDHIHEVALVGGEPLLLPENERLLDVIPKDAVVTLITNLSVDLTDNKIFKKLVNRNRVGWSMSFDNIGQQFEYVRHGSNWELMKKNLATIKGLMKNQGHWGGAHSVYNLYNATQFVDFKKFLAEQEFTVVWQLLFQPNYLDPFLHNRRVAELASEEIQRFYSTGLATDDEKRFFDSALDKYGTITNTVGQVESAFVEHIGRIENRFHRDQLGQFKKLWPELALAIPGLS